MPELDDSDPADIIENEQEKPKKRIATGLMGKDQMGHLESMVSKPTWKQILLDLILSDDLDPWNIDIISISNAFLKKVKEMEKLDLMIPANIILASAILLRYKSAYLKLYEPVVEVEEVNAEETVFEQIPDLEMSSRIPPKRQITLDELVNEMEKVIKYDTNERKVKIKGGIQEIVNLRLSDSDIEKRMSEIFNKIRENVDNEGWITFSKISSGSTSVEKIYVLLSLLHLTQKQVVEIKQDELFGEIFIHLNSAESTKN